MNYVQLVASYWKRIGVDVEIDVQPGTAIGARRSAGDFRLMQGESAGKVCPWGWAGGKRFTDVAWDSSNVDDPVYNAMVEAAEGASTMEELNSMVKEVNQYAIENFWTLFSPVAPSVFGGPAVDHRFQRRDEVGRESIYHRFHPPLDRSGAQGVDGFLGALSSRQDCIPAGEGPAVPITRFGYVVMPQFVLGNRTIAAWCIRPCRFVRQRTARWGHPEGRCMSDA